MASDSTNHPDRKSGAAAWKPQSITAKVAKSNSELIGPNRIMNWRMKRDVPVRRPDELLLVDAVGGDRHLARVVEQVVQQDLERQHRQEREERRGHRDAEHVAEIRRRPHQDVLDRVREDPATLDDAVGEDVEITLEQDDVGRVLRDVRRRVDRDPDVGVMQREGVVDAVAEEGDCRARRVR